MRKFILLCLSPVILMMGCGAAAYSVGQTFYAREDGKELGTAVEVGRHDFNGLVVQGVKLRTPGGDLIWASEDVLKSSYTLKPQAK